MSKQIRVTVSNAYIAALEKIAVEDGLQNGSRVDITSVVRTAIRKYLNRRGIPNDEIDTPDAKL